MTDLLSAFRGLTTPTNELYEQIGRYGWTPTKVKWEDKHGAFTAEGQNQHGEKITKTGPDEKTALGNLLIAIMRHTHMRTAAQMKVGMWKTMFTDQLEPIAKAYAEAPVYDQKAAANFKELADDSMRRMEILKQQLHIEVVDNPEPYANAQEMAKDIHTKRHFYVSRANSEHPVWTVEQNVAFRTVHDVLGHAVSGGDFGWHGENLACAAHFPLLTPTAQAALFTECIAQTAYAGYYRSFGPQKVALFPEFYEGPQSNENDPNHRGVHPSQVVAPSAMPEVQPSKEPEAYGGLPEGSIAPHMEGLGLTPVMGPATFSKVYSFARRYSSLFADPNHGWSSGIDPLDPQVHGVGNAYLHHGDPLESQAVMDNAGLVDTDWSNFKRGDGTPDRQRMKQAIVNAFRVVLLSPRKDLRWNAIHYQDISHIPADTDDPKVYWDALEQKRQAWNRDQVKTLFGGKVSPETLEQMAEDASTSHQAWRKEWPKFFNVIFQLSGGDYKKAKLRAEQTIQDWTTEEQQRIEMEDAKRPVDKQRGADEIERRAQDALVKRMKTYVKESQPKLDVFAAEQMGFDLDVPTEEPPKIDRYGAFMGTHLKAIAQISQHADELVDAALKDVQKHDGSGHHFRAAVLSLGISGVGPKVCSFAWLLLQPMTSQLATIDTHMMDVLGHNYEKEMNNRDYFKFERELAAGRDAAGYGHVPLGAFQWGMWDHKRTGEGSHQDHSAMRVLDPVPHGDVDWASKVQNLKGESWAAQAPDWWRNTQPARDHVAQDWDKNIAPHTPQNGIPYQVLNDQVRSAAVKEGAESEDEFHVGVTLPEHIFDRCSEIATGLKLDSEDPINYHITMFWTKVGYSDRDLHNWIKSKSLTGLRFENARVDNFQAQDGRNCVVLRFDAPEAKVLAHELMDEAEDRGLEVKRFPGGWKPHITLGWTEKPVPTESFPDVQFRGGHLYVSIPRPLRKTADFSKGFAYWWNKEKPHNVSDAKKMAEYARGTRTSKKDAVAFVDSHRKDVRGDFEQFKKRFVDKFDSMRESSEEPVTETNMARLVREEGLSTPEIWAKYPELKEKEDDGVLRSQESVPAQGR